MDETSKTIPTAMSEGDVVLAPSWILTTNHGASSYRIPVLVHRQTGEVYGPRDILSLPQSYGGVQPAAHLVVRFGKLLLGDDRDAARQFLSQWPGGPQLD